MAREFTTAELKTAMTLAAEAFTFSLTNGVRNPGKTCCALHGNDVLTCAKPFRGVICRDYYATSATQAVA